MSKMGLAVGASLTLLLAIAACSHSGPSDEDYAEKYRAAVENLAHVERVESSYKSTAGMGSTADVFMHADSSDPAVLQGVLEEAFPAVVEAAEGDPNTGLALQVISEDGATAVSPSDLGYEGTGTLSSYREFLAQ